MNPTIRLKPNDWVYHKRAADNTQVTLDVAAGGTSESHHLTHLSVSYDTTGSGELNVGGIAKPLSSLDLTDTGVLNISTDIFTLAGHGLANGDKLLLNMNGGTAPTGLTDYAVYYVVGVSGNNFQLSATLGGAAVNMSGTQANFGTNCVLMRVFPSIQVYDHWEMDITSMKGYPNADLIVTVQAVASLQGILNVAGYTAG